MPAAIPAKYLINISFEKLENSFTNHKMGKKILQLKKIVVLVEMGEKYDSRQNQKCSAYDQVLYQ